MRNPRVFTASELATWHISEEFEPGVWRPARPCPFFGFDFMGRVRIAWRVFTGRYDAVNWGEKSGEWTNDQIRYVDCTEPGFRVSGKDQP